MTLLGELQPHHQGRDEWQFTGDPAVRDAWRALRGWGPFADTRFGRAVPAEPMHRLRLTPLDRLCPMATICAGPTRALVATSRQQRQHQIGRLNQQVVEQRF